LSGGGGVVVCCGGGGRDIVVRCDGVVFSCKHFCFRVMDAVTMVHVIFVFVFIFQKVDYGCRYPKALV